MQANEKIRSNLRKIGKTVNKYKWPLAFAGVAAASAATLIYCIDKGYPDYLPDMDRSMDSLRYLSANCYCSMCKPDLPTHVSWYSFHNDIPPFQITCSPDYPTHGIEEMRQGISISLDYLNQSINSGLSFEGQEALIETLSEARNMDDPEKIKPIVSSANNHLISVWNEEISRSRIYKILTIPSQVGIWLGSLASISLLYRECSKSDSCDSCGSVGENK